VSLYLGILNYRSLYNGFSSVLDTTCSNVALLSIFLALFVYFLVSTVIAWWVEMTMGMGFLMGMGIPWDSHGNENW